MRQWKWTRRPERGTLEDASKWVALLKSGESQHEAPFSEWLGRSPVNLDAFLVMAGFDQELDRFLDRLPSDLRGSARPQSWAAMSRARWFPRAAAAACIGVFLATGGWYLFAPDPPADVGEYRTRIGEHRELTLSDGSTVHLNTRSRLTYRLSRKSRDLKLTSGEVFFIVAKDRNRPFRVYTETAVVQAVGTRFNVNTHGDRMAIAVLEGKVQLALPGTAESGEPTRFTPLRAGESMEIKRTQRGADLHVTAVAPESLERRVTWMSGILSFDNETLANIIAEMNRYNQQQVVIADPQIANLQIGGRFNATDLHNFLESLGNIAKVEAEWPDPSRAGTEPVRLRGVPAAATSRRG